jgi:aminoglycoside phosphotransferase (APT) family kinase protein
MSDVTQVDIAALDAWCRAHVAGYNGPLSAEKFATGQSNPTFLIEAASGKYVLRRKPPGQLLKSAHAVEREYAVMQALAATAVPVPRMLALCENAGVIGTPFYVMAHVDGRIFWDPAVPEVSRDDRAAIYDEMNRVLAALHALDPQALGLGGFGKPGNYFARQITRWSDQYRASETGAIADMDALMAWLAGHVPPDDGRVSIVHGDYRIDNFIFAKDAPKLIAVLDWELSTLGHPFADLAYQCMQWRLPHEGAFRGLAGVDRAALGIPTEDEYVALYCKRAGLGAIAHWNFYLAFSFFRLAAILQGVKKRALDGNASNPERGLKMGAAVPVLAQMAMQLVESAAP